MFNWSQYLLICCVHKCDVPEQWCRQQRRSGHSTSASRCSFQIHWTISSQTFPICSVDVSEINQTHHSHRTYSIVLSPVKKKHEKHVNLVIFKMKISLKITWIKLKMDHKSDTIENDLVYRLIFATGGQLVDWFHQAGQIQDSSMEN